MSVLAIAKKQREHPGSSVQIREIASAHNLPQEYIGKLLTILVKARILNSGRGREGGFTLRLRSSEISILDIMEAVDGPVEANTLIGHSDGQVSAIIETTFTTALDKLRESLKNRTIEMLLREMGDKGHARGSTHADEAIAEDQSGQITTL